MANLKEGQASLEHYYIVNKAISLAELPAAFEQRASELPQEEAALRNEKETHPALGGGIEGWFTGARQGTREGGTFSGGATSQDGKGP
jgi:hypothetical protein